MSKVSKVRIRTLLTCEVTASLASALACSVSAYPSAPELVLASNRPSSSLLMPFAPFSTPRRDCKAAVRERSRRGQMWMLDVDVDVDADVVWGVVRGYSKGV